MLSATSHPGYELHILLTQYFVAYNMILMGSSDFVFFYFTLYIAYQLDVCKHLVSTLGAENNGQVADTRRLRRVAWIQSNLCKLVWDSSIF